MYILTLLSTCTPLHDIHMYNNYPTCTLSHDIHDGYMYTHWTTSSLFSWVVVTHGHHSTTIFSAKNTFLLASKHGLETNKHVFSTCDKERKWSWPYSTSVHGLISILQKDSPFSKSIGIRKSISCLLLHSHQVGHGTLNLMLRVHGTRWKKTISLSHRERNSLVEPREPRVSKGSSGGAYGYDWEKNQPEFVTYVHRSEKSYRSSYTLILYVWMCDDDCQSLIIGVSWFSYEDDEEEIPRRLIMASRDQRSH